MTKKSIVIKLNRLYNELERIFEDLADLQGDLEDLIDLAGDAEDEEED